MDENSLSIDLKEIRHQDQSESQKFSDDLDDKYSKIEINEVKQSKHRFELFLGFLKNLTLPSLCFYALIFYCICYLPCYLRAMPSDLNTYVLTFTVCLLFISLRELPKINIIPICVLAAITSYVFCESMQNAYVMKSDNSVTTYSFLFVLMFFLPGCLNLRYSRMYLIIITVIFEIFGIAQYYSLHFRESPLRPFDFKAFKSALEIKSSYSFQDQRGILSGIIGVVNVFSIYRFTFGKNIVPTPKILRVLVLLFFTSLLIFFGFCTSYISDDLKNKDAIHTWNAEWTYRNIGCGFYFYMEYRIFSLTKPPPGYSIKKAKAILKEYTSDERIDKTKLRRPHIITILSESFTDYKIVKNFETNVDYMPFIRSLKNNTIKGNITISPYGGLTCNSEYEYLTGNSMSFYPFHTPAYLGLVNNKQQSMIEYLTSLGYDTYAFTGSTRGMWNTGVVYDMLGFNHSYFEKEYYNYKDTYRNLPTDKSVIKGMINVFENRTKDKPVFMFLTTMQNHGQFPLVPNTTVNAVKFNNPSHINTYLTGLKLSDDAMKYTLDYFKKLKEDVVVVFFGDHYPNVPAFLKALTGYTLQNSPVKIKSKLFTTPFFIWTNYETKPEEGHYFALSYLSSKVMEVAGLPKTPYMKFLDEMKKHVPLLTPFCYGDSTGKWHLPNEKTDLTPYLNKYLQVQYYMINDRKK